MFQPELEWLIAKQKTRERMRDAERWRLLRLSPRPRRLGDQIDEFVLWLGGWPIRWVQQPQQPKGCCQERLSL